MVWGLGLRFAEMSGMSVELLPMSYPSFERERERERDRRRESERDRVSEE